MLKGKFILSAHVCVWSKPLEDTVDENEEVL